MVVVKAKRKKGKLVIKVKEGALHSELGVKQGKKLTANETAIRKDDSPLLKKRKQFAINARSWSHK